MVCYFVKTWEKFRFSPGTLNFFSTIWLKRLIAFDLIVLDPLFGKVPFRPDFIPSP